MQDTLTTVFRNPPACGLCCVKIRRGVLCVKCQELFCRQRDRACLAVHYGEVHP